MHFNVTAGPTAAWIWRQVVEATPSMRRISKPCSPISLPTTIGIGRIEVLACRVRFQPLSRLAGGWSRARSWADCTVLTPGRHDLAGTLPPVKFKRQSALTAYFPQFPEG